MAFKRESDNVAMVIRDRLLHIYADPNQLPRTIKDLVARSLGDEGVIMPPTHPHTRAHTCCVIGIRTALC